MNTEEVVENEELEEEYIYHSFHRRDCPNPWFHSNAAHVCPTPDEENVKALKSGAFSEWAKSSPKYIDTQKAVAILEARLDEINKENTPKSKKSRD